MDTSFACKFTVPYIANCLRWKSLTYGQATFNWLENFCSLLTPLIFKETVRVKPLSSIRNQNKLQVI